jgi:hypothetical protein
MAQVEAAERGLAKAVVPELVRVGALGPVEVPERDWAEVMELVRAGVRVVELDWAKAGAQGSDWVEALELVRVRVKVTGSDLVQAMELVLA